MHRRTWHPAAADDWTAWAISPFGPSAVFLEANTTIALRMLQVAPGVGATLPISAEFSGALGLRRLVEASPLLAGWVGEAAVGERAFVKARAPHDALFWVVLWHLGAEVEASGWFPAADHRGPPQVTIPLRVSGELSLKWDAGSG